jgi:Family of unknown function (DUF5675)
VNASRRLVLLSVPIWIVAPLAFSQIQPSYLRLVRRGGWEEMMGRNKCVIGDLFYSNSMFPISDLGTKICNVLELPYRNNLNDISAVPIGDYEGFVRVDGSRGWRIELKGTKPRENIQMHIGNQPNDSTGCLLPGTGESSDAKCNISDSATGMAKIKSIVGESTNAKVVLRVQS